MPVYDFLVEVNDYLNIRENHILNVWFNAWLYEIEEQFAAVALTKTIAYAMGEHHAYKDIKPIMLRGLAIVTNDISTQYSFEICL
jgi:hypothetical protein